MNFKDRLLTAVVLMLGADPLACQNHLDLLKDDGFRYHARNLGQYHHGDSVSGKYNTQGESTIQHVSTAKVPQLLHDPTYTTYRHPREAEDPIYHFDFATHKSGVGLIYQRTETGGQQGQVSGAYSYVDDVGDIHNVEFEADSQRGFHVKTPYPDSNHNYNELYFRGDGRVPLRGRTSIQRGLDGSYKFTTHSQDQSRCEVKDALGNTEGSYIYIDKAGVQRYVHYIAGPNVGYRVVLQGSGAIQDPTVFKYLLCLDSPGLGIDNLLPSFEDDSGGKRPLQPVDYATPIGPQFPIVGYQQPGVGGHGEAGGKVEGAPAAGVGTPGFYFPGYRFDRQRGETNTDCSGKAGSCRSAVVSSKNLNADINFHTTTFNFHCNSNSDRVCYR